MGAVFFVISWRASFSLCSFIGNFCDYSPFHCCYSFSCRMWPLGCWLWIFSVITIKNFGSVLIRKITDVSGLQTDPSVMWPLLLECFGLIPVFRGRRTITCSARWFGMFLHRMLVRPDATKRQSSTDGKWKCLSSSCTSYFYNVLSFSVLSFLPETCCWSPCKWDLKLMLHVCPLQLQSY